MLTNFHFHARSQPQDHVLIINFWAFLSLDVLVKKGSYKEKRVSVLSGIPKRYVRPFHDQARAGEDFPVVSVSTVRKLGAFCFTGHWPS